MRKIHRKNISCLRTNLDFSFSYIPVKKRNNNKIVIITEQLLLNNHHAPTLMTLEIAFTLQKYFHYDVEIITCTSNKPLPKYLWTFTKGFNSAELGYEQIPDKNSILYVRNIHWLPAILAIISNC